MRTYQTILAILFAAIAVGLIYFGMVFYYGTGDHGKQRIEIRVLPGSTLRDVERLLESEGLLKHSTIFRWTAVLMGKDRRIQHGRYLFYQGESLADILRRLTRAEVMLTRLTIPEGQSLREIAGVVSRKLELDSLAFYQLARDTAFVRECGLKAPTLEGYLFPDTYLFSWPVTTRDVALRMVERFREVFGQEMQRFPPGLDLTANEIVTLASIIESEAQVEREMERISAVYHNRLRKGIRLEADPTVAYALGGVRRELKYRDLRVKSPYNTYRNKGLPPGPICSPGRAALIAAVRPLPGCDDLFFVADGSGGHIFSKTHKEHLRARELAEERRVALALAAKADSAAADSTRAALRAAQAVKRGKAAQGARPGEAAPDTARKDNAGSL
jgi:UPF0755 protein